jgi:hypothetical protein
LKILTQLCAGLDIAELSPMPQQVIQVARQIADHMQQQTEVRRKSVYV